MAVPYYRRSISKKEYFYNFKKIQKEIISLLLRDFGIRETDDEICISDRVKEERDFRISFFYLCLY